MKNKLLSLSTGKCAMTWCISYTCITCSFSTGTRMPRTDEGDRTEGGREALPGSTGGVIISRAALTVSDYAPSCVGPGYHRM